MVRWANEDLEAYVRRRNEQQNDKAGSAGAAPQLECSSGDGALAKTQTQSPDTATFLVRVTSRRKRLCDEDNLCEKFHVDCLRYAGIIPEDAPNTTHIEVKQEKIGKGEQEEVVITIERL